MLAQSFKTAEELKISDIELRSLIMVLGMLERDEFVHGKQPTRLKARAPNEFNMAAEFDDAGCGTIGCMAGWAYAISGKEAFPEIVNCEWDRRSKALWCLFGIGRYTDTLEYIKPEQAACALRSYLTTGDARWDLAVTTGQ